jgi:hypothetical protein
MIFREEDSRKLGASKERRGLCITVKPLFSSVFIRHIAHQESPSGKSKIIIIF